MTRLYFTSDIHGSEVCWKKFLNAGDYYKADVIYLGGDITGKMIVPIISSEGGTYNCDVFGRSRVVKNKEDLEDLFKTIRNAGYYPYTCTSQEHESLSQDDSKVKTLFKRVMLESIERWMTMADKKKSANVKIIVSPGNDDIFEVDEILKSHPASITYADQNVVQIDDKHPMISLAWTNPSPWKSPRECSEEELEKKLEFVFGLVDDKRNLICGLHAPPYNSNIDIAPQLDENLKPVIKAGTIVREPVGSKAVRASIERYQPLVDLAGHIHESAGRSYIGRTLIVNPGSEYGEGVLKGYLLDIEDGKIKNHAGLTG